MSQCPFHVLNLPATATKEEVLKQWKQLARHMHPDKNPDDHATERTQEINDAKDRAIEQCIARDRGGSGWDQAAWMREFQNDLKEQRRQAEKEWEEADRKHKEEQDKKHKEEAEQKRMEEEEQRQIEEHEKAIYKTVFAFLSKSVDAPWRKTCERSRTIDQEFFAPRKAKTGKSEQGCPKDQALFDMAEAINKTSAERPEAELRKSCADAERKGREDAEQRLADVEKKLGDESKAKDEATRQLAEMKVKLEGEKTSKDEAVKQLADNVKKLEDERRAKDEAVRQLAEMTCRLENERKSKDDAKQQLAEMTTQMEYERKSKDEAKQQLTGMTMKMEDERKSKNDAKQQSAELSTAINTERKFKTDAQQKLAEMTTQFNDERKSKDEIKQQLEDMTVKMEDERQSKDDTSQKLVDMTANYDAFRQEAELKIKLAEEIQHPIDSHSSNGSNARKRRVPSGNTEISGITLQTRVKEFVDAHIMPCNGSFLPTRVIHDAFLAENGITDPSMVPDCTFQKILKNYTLDVFSAQSKVSYSRLGSSKERAWGYTGLTLN
jgi:hypothetical protein